MGKQVNGHEVIQLFESFSPKKYAMEDDPIGLQVGQLNKPVKKVLVALDVLEEVVDEAIEMRADLIIAHHPPIFRPLKKLALDSASGRIIEKLIKHDIAVYAAHTNLDVAKGGVNDLLADALGLKDTKVMVPTFEEKLKKLAVFVPESHESEVREALANAGAGAIGAYSRCSFSSNGTGRFLPGEGTDPYIGAKGKLEEVKECRIETIFPENIERKVISAMMKAHPYEEPAYDIFPLDNQGEMLGLGRVGSLDKELSLKEFALHVKEVFDLEGLRVAGDLSSPIKKVAVLGGDGNKYFSQAKFNGADVYVTGDFYYHTAHDAMMMGLNIVDPGHNVEKVMKAGVAKRMEALSKELGWEIEFTASELNTDPFQFL
ncbi:Nif3-like dinuclear metal center hexameric protein [Falsibacillus pallidus]|uniref:Nif3-like dinuclear metal center hexameric protein n=1 Tax=Falsibacillus pallidus TaxID=493781 RepID=UPI003D9620A8